MYTLYNYLVLVIIYSFIGWCIEEIANLIIKRKLVNVGFLSLPFILTYGITMYNVALLLPSLDGNYILQFISVLIQASVLDSLGNFILYKFTGLKWPGRGNLFGGNIKGFMSAIIIAAGYYVFYLIVHPILLGLLPLFSILPVKIVVCILSLLIFLDFILSVWAARSGNYNKLKDSSQSRKLGQLLNFRIWNRIDKAYPGIRHMNEDEEKAAFTFGKGLSIYKLIWVLFISALIGDCIEMVYCRLVGGFWMSRSSVLIGPFSLVWGIGAVVLTISLMPLARKNDRWVFIGGFFIGGTYEYLCSVFTEIVFGRVFWDYSNMPLNINGRTNVAYMVAWGLLSVLWVKIIYPPMSDFIEKIPPLTGLIITWAFCLFMVLNGALTGIVMYRYNVRQTDPSINSEYENFLDSRYTDEFMENRWPNMKVNSNSKL